MSKNIEPPRNLPDFSGLDLDFDIVDSHHHLFDLDAVYYPWLTGQPEDNFLLGDYEALKRDYSPADYRADRSGLRVTKTVHVEAEADHGDPLRETRWLAGVMAREGLPDALVAHAWLHKPESERILAEQAAFPAVRGIRSKPVTRSSASAAGVQDQPASLQDPVWQLGLGLLRRFNLSWDLRVPFWHLGEAAAVCGLYPDLPIVVEHTGLAWDRSADGLAEWSRGMAALADHENVHVKISELGLATEAWDYEDNRRIVLRALELFGFERAMFASNFPVAGLRIGFADQLKAIAHMIRDVTPGERAALFHDTACRFYRL